MIGSRFQQGDDSIVVLGTLTSVVNPAVEQALAPTAESDEPLIAASGPSNAASEQRVVSVSAEVARAAAAPSARRKLSKKAPADQANESKQEGKTA